MPSLDRIRFKKRYMFRARDFSEGEPIGVSWHLYINGRLNKKVRIENYFEFTPFNGYFPIEQFCVRWFPFRQQHTVAMTTLHTAKRLVLDLVYG